MDAYFLLFGVTKWLIAAIKLEKNLEPVFFSTLYCLSKPLFAIKAEFISSTKYVNG